MDQLNIFDYIREPFEVKNKIRLIELFGGIGSQAMALRNIGADFEHYRLCEWEQHAVDSYNAIHGTNFEASDITKLKGSDLGIVDTDSFTYLLTYSFPCQDLSVAGLMRGFNEGSQTRSSLLWEVKRLLSEVENLPQILVMENVTQVHSEGDNIKNFYKWISFLEELGYSNYWQDMDAKDYGIAQSRNRTFMISLLGDYTYHFPVSIPLTNVMKDYLEDSVEDKYYITTEKAKKLIDKLVIGGKLLTDRQTDS